MNYLTIDQFSKLIYRKDFRQLNAPEKGKCIQEFIKLILKTEKYFISNRINRDHDFILNNKYKIEVKGSTEWGNSQTFKFQQIRDNDWNFLCCLGISNDNNLYFYWVDKLSIVNEWTSDRKVITGQHTGSTAKETKWANIKYLKPDYLFGTGTFENFLKSVKESVK